VPVVPLLMIPLTLLRKLSDGSRLLYDFRRPVPYRVGTIGMWNYVLRVLSRLVMVTNAGVVLVTLRGMEVEKRRSANLVAAEIVAVLFLILLFVLPSSSESFDIKVQRLRSNFIVKRITAMAAEGDADVEAGGGGGQRRTGHRGSVMPGASSEDDGETPEQTLKKRRSLTGAAYHHYSV